MVIDVFGPTHLIGIHDNDHVTLASHRRSVHVRGGDDTARTGDGAGANTLLGGRGDMVMQAMTSSTAVASDMM